ncbi:MAG: hypothetical protein U0I89_01285, partial [Prevotella sp.]|nr:hypothetical protein [Prevotella sp.]
MHRTPLVLATALLTSVSAFAQTEISTEAQLKAIANNLNGDYVLTQDIELSDAEWTPIGTSDHPFTGTLDGQGHTIKGLTVGNGANNDANKNKAFFGFTNGATVKNIGFTSAVVKGHEQAAIVVAQATSSTLSNIYVSGVVTGHDHVGTIAGDARGTTDKPTTITNCVSTAAALSTEHQGGGIAGWTNNSTFSYNIAYGAVTAPSNGAGGITGMVDNGGSSVYTSNLSAAPYIKGSNDHTHGINGWCNGNCSNTDNNNLSWANTVYYVGGNEKKATDITEPSNGSGIHGTVTATEDLKKAATYTGIGFSTDTWELTDGQWPRLRKFATMHDAFTSISALPNIIKPGQTVTVTATTALNRPISSITSSNNDIISVDGNTLNAKKSGTCNITIASTSDDLAQGASRTFTITVEAVNHTISTPDDLDKLRYDMTGDYVLANDIDMTGRSFVPFGIVEGENAGKFTGTFDGNGHTIKGLKYDVEGKGEVGLFSQTDNATIKNLIIEGAYFKGNANVGGIVGRMYRTNITDCAVLNSYIEGRDHVGAIAGEIAQTKKVDNSYEGGTITNCFSDARIKTREFQAGGMLGTIHCGTVEKNLFTGTVEGREGDNANGMVSLVDKNDAESFIQYNVVAAAHIYGKIGRVVSNNRLGSTDKGKVTKNYVSANTWVSTKAENATLAKYSDPNDYNGADIPVDKLRTKDFYTNTLGWDFDNHWTFLPNAEGKMYPVLKIMEDKTLPNTFWHTPTTTKLTYGSGEEKISTHSSYGLCINPSLTKGSDIAIIDGNDIKAKESGYTLVGEGEVTASFNIDPTIASHFSGTHDEITFEIKNGTEPIASADDFVNKLKANAEGHYVLTNDIDLARTDLSALGNSNSNYTFKGSINGQGHVVSNASLTQEEEKDNIGIIAKTKDAVLRDIAFVDYSVNTKDKGKHVGLIGSAENTIFKNVYARGSVYGNDHVALLAGDGNGCTLTNCMVDGSVKARSQVGGFFGCTLEGGATFNHCLATGNLRTTYRGWEGGFIGLVDKRSTISIQQCASAMKCWSYGVTDSERNTQPFIGGNGADGANGILFFNNNLVSSEFISDAPDNAWPNRNRTIDGGNVTDATTYTTNEAQTSYDANGWDLGTTWTLNPDAAHPVLTAFASVAAHQGVTLEAENDNASKIKTANNAISDVSLTRTLEANIWNTFCVPFGFKVENSALAGAEVKEYDKIDGTTMYMKDATYILPGRPYLVKPDAPIVDPTFSAVAIYNEDVTKVGNDTYTLIGTYSPKTISEDNIYGVKANGAIAKGKKGTTIKGLR